MQEENLENSRRSPKNADASTALPSADSRQPSADNRQSTGVPGLDDHLGGGLLPGALTVVVGATGIGKTQLGLQFAAAGKAREARRGIVLDMNARGDSQHHAQYARRIDDWQLKKNNQVLGLADYFSINDFGDYLQALTYSGRRVTRSEADFEQWQAWSTLR